MDYLWSPWRYRYVSEGSPTECVFCTKASEQRDAENYILLRGVHNFVLLNLYPYTTGHLMIAPYQHVGALEQADEETVEEMMRLARQANRILGTVYSPRGMNLGMNLGECAGAGVADHIHMHVVPRWPADANFMTIIGETRVLPEDLPVTYKKLFKAFHA